MKTIVITGGTGRFGKVIKNSKTKFKIFFPQKRELDILDEKKIHKYLQKKKPNYLIHLAGLSRPMNIHDKDIKKSINLNIIGTANITKVCAEKKIKLIYFSTSYVYPGVKGNYKEDDPLLPINNYAWSKLGGESSVHLYKNSLIIRACMTERPFVHASAFANVKASFAYHDEIVSFLFKILDKKGIVNIGGKGQFVYDFAKKDNKNLKKIYLSKKSKIGMPFDSTINLSKLKRYLKK